jgi:hypothetical protein
MRTKTIPAPTPIQTPDPLDCLPADKLSNPLSCKGGIALPSSAKKIHFLIAVMAF